MDINIGCGPWDPTKLAFVCLQLERLLYIFDVKMTVVAHNRLPVIIRPTIRDVWQTLDGYVDYILWNKLLVSNVHICSSKLVR